MMPISFKYSNRTLGPPVNDTNDVMPLPVWTDEVQCVSCWKLSWWERFSALFFGIVWVGVLSGGTQPPIYLTATKNYLQEAPDA